MSLVEPLETILGLRLVVWNAKMKKVREKIKQHTIQNN
jgi:hypothetical protein